MSKTLIYLVRHGQSVHNLRKRVAGQLPSYLTEQGLEDARSVARVLEGLQFDVIYSSDLQRVRQTVETIRNDLALSCPVSISPLLRELDYGEFTNRTVKETFVFFDYRLIRNRRYPGGEGFEDLERRVLLFVRQLRFEALGKHILITAHAGSIRLLLVVLGAIQPHEMSNQFIGNRYVGRVVLNGSGEFSEYSILSQGPINSFERGF